MKTLYLDKMPEDADLLTLEKAIGREVSEVAYKTPAINIETDDMEIIEDARYWLQAMGCKIEEVA